MRTFLLNFVAASLATASFLAVPVRAHSAPGPAFARELFIRHEMHAQGGVKTSVKGTIRITTPAGAAALQHLKASDQLSGATAESFEALLIRANGYEQRLHAASPNAEIKLPELFIGDTLRFEGKSNAVGTQIGEGFAVSRSFPLADGYEKVEVTIVASSLRVLKHATEHFHERFEMKTDGNFAQFSLVAPKIALGTDREATIYPVPFYALSTFESGKALAAMIVKQIGPLGENSPSIIALAEKLASKSETKRQEAQAILEWLTGTVQRNTNFVMAQWPLRPTAMVMAIQSGSALEIAQLYRALLAARGIRGELILSHRHDQLLRSDLAVPDFDAVLVHMPELDQYAELSAEFPLNGAFNPSFAGRSAIRLTEAGASHLVFPAVSANTSKLRIFSEMHVSASGALTGQTRTEGHGPASALLHANVGKLARLTPEQRKRFLLERQNLFGHASIFHAGPSDDGQRYVAELDFRLDGETAKDGSITIPVFAGPRFAKGAHVPFIAALRDERGLPFRCFAEDASQDIVIHLPKDYPLPRLPTNINVEVAQARYTAQYSFIGHAMKVSRRLVLDPPSTVCTREMAKEMAPALRAAARDMSRRIVIRGPED